MLGGAPGVTGWIALALVTVTTISLMCTQSTFWALPTAVLSGAASAAGIAWINSVGNLAGYLSPFLVGKIRDTTGSMTLAYFLLGGACLITAVLVVAVTRQRSREERALSSSATK